MNRCGSVSEIVRCHLRELWKRIPRRSEAAAEYLKHGAADITPPLLDLAREASLYAQDWLNKPTPQNWEKLRKASRELEEERLNYFR